MARRCRARALLSGIILLTSQAALAAIDALAEIAKGEVIMQISRRPRASGDRICALRSRRRLPPLKANKFCRKLDPRVREDDGFEVSGIIPDSSARRRNRYPRCAVTPCGWTLANTYQTQHGFR